MEAGLELPNSWCALVAAVAVVAMGPGGRVSEPVVAGSAWLGCGRGAHHGADVAGARSFGRQTDLM